MFFSKETTRSLLCRSTTENIIFLYCKLIKYKYTNVLKIILLSEILILLKLIIFFFSGAQISHIDFMGFVYYNGFTHIKTSSEDQSIKQGYTITYSIIQDSNLFWCNTACLYFTTGS